MLPFGFDLRRLFASTLTVFITACGASPETVESETAATGDQAAAVTRFTDLAVAHIEQATLLKSSELQSSAPGAGPSCALTKGSLLRFVGAVTKTPTGHYAVTLSSDAVVPGCLMPLSGRTLFVFAPHVKLIEYREAQVTTSDAQQLRVLVCKGFPAATKSAVMLLHPAGTSAEETWFASGLFSRLESAGFCALAMDWRGHGGSSKPKDAAAYSAARLQSDLIEVLDALGVARAHFHGYSLGGSMLIRALSALSAQGRVLSVAFAGAGLPTGAPDDVSGQSRQVAEQIDQQARAAPNPFRTPRDAAAFAALLQRAPWTEPLAPLPFARFQFRALGLFGAFDNPVQNTRTFARQMGARYVGTVSFSNRLHIGTIAPATMPSAYATALVDFFSGRSPVIPSSEGVLLSASQVGRSEEV